MDHNILITIQDPIVSSIYYINWWHSGIHCGFRCYSQCNCIYPSISKSRKSYRPILHETSTHSNVKDKQVGFTLIANLRRMLHNVLPVSACDLEGNACSQSVFSQKHVNSQCQVSPHFKIRIVIQFQWVLHSK